MTDIGIKFPVNSGPPPAPASGRASGVGDSISAQVKRLEDAARPTKEPSDKVDAKASLEKLAKLIDRFVPKELPNTRLQITHDDTTGLFVYKSVDAESGEVVRQYPSDEILRFISFYREREGILVDNRV